MSELVKTAIVASETERVEREDEEIKVGQWYWTENGKRRYLGCIVHVGSNFVKVEEAGRSHHSTIRVHLDKFEEYCVERELNPEIYIDKRIEHHRGEVAQLMGRVRQLCSKLGLTPAGQLADVTQETSTALAVAHGTADIKAHKKALILAKEKTLPELFKKIKEQHAEMADWMQAQLIPMEAEAKQLTQSTSSIEDRIFTVELYAGLSEECELLREGEPAGNNEKVHLFQRRHYMDEECLFKYKAGGMDFKGISAFDRWLMKKGNRERILPKPKCIVAFRVRRFNKDYTKWVGARSMSDFLQFRDFNEANKWTFLYMRNGERYYRLSTSVEFGESLFPDVAHSKLLGGGQLYIKKEGISGYHGENGLINEQEHFNIQENFKRRKIKHREELKKWKATPKKDRVGFEPTWWSGDDSPQYVPLTQDHVYYDDAMQLIQQAAREHNRVAVVLQGILDRSPVFHPHPPWQLWTPEGFSSGIELVYDESRAVSDGDPPDFEAYRDVLNASIERGTHVVGQHFYWMRQEAEKENERQANDWRIRRASDYYLHEPYGNPGPGTIAKVEGVSRDKKKLKFSWERKRQTTKWIVNPDRPSRLMPDPSGVKTHLKVPVTAILNADAYTPGDFLMFYKDPRTRQQYMKWAPLMLACEDWHGTKKK